MADRRRGAKCRDSPIRSMPYERDSKSGMPIDKINPDLCELTTLLRGECKQCYQFTGRTSTYGAGSGQIPE